MSLSSVYVVICTWLLIVIQLDPTFEFANVQDDFISHEIRIPYEPIRLSWNVTRVLEKNLGATATLHNNCFVVVVVVFFFVGRGGEHGNIPATTAMCWLNRVFFCNPKDLDPSKLAILRTLPLLYRLTLPLQGPMILRVVSILNWLIMSRNLPRAAPISAVKNHQLLGGSSQDVS